MQVVTYKFSSLRRNLVSLAGPKFSSILRMLHIRLFHSLWVMSKDVRAFLQMQSSPSYFNTVHVLMLNTPRHTIWLDFIPGIILSTGTQGPHLNRRSRFYFSDNLQDKWPRFSPYREESLF